MDPNHSWEDEDAKLGGKKKSTSFVEPKSLKVYLRVHENAPRVYFLKWVHSLHTVIYVSLPSLAI